ncbi:MAG: hypothetical protein AVDCRST_MAG86-130 [uncultured Truepera sp.]|uniref:Lipoprotein n=1 Tax=uncultured Truepera sp. TaxID=543023 RepID=A0A6J4UPV8_9DEIN|nr:MAG: hypothetical protein AVDCRST_MAG86-130 [uncultured Truepera sp.]
MRRFLLLFVVSFLVPALSACTGTFEPSNPVLLVTGYRDDAGSHVALIEDSFGETGPSEDRLRFLPDSVQNLPAPAASYDIVDREGTRNTLVVLSRGAVVAGNSTSYLTFLSLRSIDPDNPVNFEPTRLPRVISRDTVTLPDTLTNPQFCPSSVQVTQTGAYAAVLNEPGLCRFGGQPFIDIFSLQTEPIRLLQRINRVAAGGFYLGQSPAQDLLYYATNESRSLRLQRATLPRPGETFGPDDTVTVETVADVTSTIGNDFVDLGRSGISGDERERLVVLFEESLVNVTGFTGEGTASEAIVTPPNNARVVRDDQCDTEATLILGTLEARRFSYVPTSTSEEDVELEVESASVAAVDAVIEPTNGFVYFAANGGVLLFDLNSYNSGDTLPDPTPFPVTSLPNPSFITWAQSVPAPATP